MYLLNKIDAAVFFLLIFCSSFSVERTVYFCIHYSLPTNEFCNKNVSLHADLYVLFSNSVFALVQ